MRGPKQHPESEGRPDYQPLKEHGGVHIFRIDTALSKVFVEQANTIDHHENTHGFCACGRRAYATLGDICSVRMTTRMSPAQTHIATSHRRFCCMPGGEVCWPAHHTTHMRCLEAFAGSCARRATSGRRCLSVRDGASPAAATYKADDARRRLARCHACGLAHGTQAWQPPRRCSVFLRCCPGPAP